MGGDLVFNKGKLRGSHAFCVNFTRKRNLHLAQPMQKPAKSDTNSARHAVCWYAK